jgi:hypothetical protein
VQKLKRVAIGPITDPKLLPGVWRELTKHEVKLLATLKDVPVKAKPKARRAPAKKKPAAKTRGKKAAAPARRRATRRG